MEPTQNYVKPNQIRSSPNLDDHSNNSNNSNNNNDLKEPTKGEGGFPLSQKKNLGGTN